MAKVPYSELEVAHGVWQVAGFHGWRYGVNAVNLTSEENAIFVDTLCSPKEARRLFQRIRRWGVEPVALVNAHWHTDHTMRNSLFDCPIWSQRLGPRYLKRY